MGLEFKDIGEWTPSTISIVDVPYHPLAYFEVYENDEEFVKKFKETKVNNMSNNPNGEKTVTVSEGFIEGLINKAVAKMKSEPPVEPNPAPAPQQNNGESEVTNAQILAAIQQYDERITALENGQNQNQNQSQGVEDPTQNNGSEQNEENNEQNNNETNPQNGTDPTPQTVELPLNPDGTLNMDDGVVAKYLPRGTSQSQALDVDLTRGTPSDKSLNVRTGRDANGMSW